MPSHQDSSHKFTINLIGEDHHLINFIISVTDKRTLELEKVSDYIIDVPSTHPKVFPILSSISLQLLAYHLAVLRQCDVDQPRNLAKSVTVE